MQALKGHLCRNPLASGRQRRRLLHGGRDEQEEAASKPHLFFTTATSLVPTFAPFQWQTDTLSCLLMFVGHVQNIPTRHMSAMAAFTEIVSLVKKPAKLTFVAGERVISSECLTRLVPCSAEKNVLRLTSWMHALLQQ